MQCKYKEKCPMFPVFKNTFGLQVFKLTYCESINHNKCERFKLASVGSMPPANLLPNGKQLANQ